VVAENGALLYEPATETPTLLGPEPPVPFIERLKERRVSPLSIGRCIVATLEPNEKIVLETIRELGLEMQIIFNKGAVMVLPPRRQQGDRFGGGSGADETVAAECGRHR